MDTFGNCQRPVFSTDVSKHMHKITSLSKFQLNWSSNLQENNERKYHPYALLCELSDMDLEWINKIGLISNYGVIIAACVMGPGNKLNGHYCCLCYGARQ